MLNVGGPELLIILLVALVFLGPQRLPEIARQAGQMMSSLRSLASGFQAELDAATKPDVDSSMTLDGPTDQAQAIAATQPAGWAVTDPFASAKSAASEGTNTDELKAAARRVDHDTAGEKPVSAGGPADLNPTDSGADDAAQDEEE